MAVILERDGSEELAATAVLDAVDEQARRYGVRPGMKVVEATALASGLAIERVTFDELEAELARVAELVTSLAPIVSVRLEHARAEEEGSRDTIWLDVTGAAHLVGGEEALVDEIVVRAASLGHRARAAVSDGPRLAEAIARFSPAGAPFTNSRASLRSDAPGPVVPPGGGAAALAELPLAALPLDTDTVGWFLRLGLVAAGDSAKLPRAALAARIPARAPLVLDLLAGRDEAPLVPFEPPRVLVEEASFEEGVASTEALLFVMRGMSSRMSARLTGRGEACTRLEVHLSLDEGILTARARGDRSGDVPPAHVELAVDLPAPLAAETDLLRAVRARLERVELAAPVVSMALVVPAIVCARRVQLDLSRNTAIDPDALPTLLAELSAEIGAAGVGVLALRDAHAPEAMSALVPADVDGPGPAGLVTPPRPMAAIARVTRLLPAPVPLGEVGLQRVVAVDQALYAVEPRSFVLRLDEVGWWTASPISRDYMAAWFVAGERGRPGAVPVAGEGLVYVERRTGEAFLQGWLE